MSETTYILGHSDAELRRLELQATVLEPLTRRLLRDLALTEGMSVLDIGTGAGDVALLAGALVGPKGRVRGIDRTGAVLARARARARQAQRDWIGFDEIDFRPGVALGSYDVVIGRFVLMHQPEPVAFLRLAASHVREGGVVAFIEMAQPLEARYSVPRVGPHDEAMNALLAAFGRAGADLDIGSRLTALFAEAGLPEPSLISETPVGGRASVLPEWLARTIQSVGLASPDGDASWHALADAIRTQATASRSQLFGPRSVAAWSRPT